MHGIGIFAERVTQGAGRWLRVQLALSFGLMPMTLALFGEASLVSVLANLVAIPLTTFAVVPALLSGVLFAPVSPELSALLFVISGHLGAVLLWWIDLMASVPSSRLTLPGLSPAAGVLAAFSVLVWLLPRAVPLRWLGLFLWLPLATSSYSRERSEFEMTVLDVGQGLAIVVQSGDDTMVYDTGARYGATSEASRVVVPWLRERHIKRVTLLVISHADNDHAGGADYLLDAIPVDEVLSSVPGKFKGASGCIAGQHRRLGNIGISVLGPPATRELSGGNNRSCVLSLVSASGRVLLSGDIESEAEKWLVERYGSKLASDVLVVPHHGARTSSTLPFLSAVRPAVAIVSAGYRNRYGHPAARVRRRYDGAGVRILGTARHGSVGVHSCAEGLCVRRWDESGLRYWHSRQR